MLSGIKNPACDSCYQEENLHRQSLRMSFNRQLAHRIYKVDSTQSDGTVSDFSLNYFDSRFNNLCNLSCRSCGPELSSSWHDVAVTLGLKDASQKPLLIAGKNKTDVFDQIVDHLDQLDVIYFAGGEPLINEQFYEILDLLDQRKKHNTKLIYNTNFTQTMFKRRSIFDQWKNFKSVSVAASLDSEGLKAEYLRSGTNWNQVVENRKKMLDICPEVDFYITATTGLINALHVADFHRSWVEQGLIQPHSFNIQILFNPDYQSIAHAPAQLKIAIKEKYREHLTWLRPLDKLGRATDGYKSVIELIDNSADVFDHGYFWSKITLLDQYYSTDLLEYFPELSKFLPVDQK
jgi:MoaA/NifB/PqqE/SkfB family radical SAM enzyme